MALKDVAVQLQLPLAIRSLTDPLAVKWISTAAHNIPSYKELKVAFKRNFWSHSKKSVAANHLQV
jgi:hypothetical protein